MARPLLHQVAEAPATTLVILCLTGVWLAIKSRNLGYGEVGLSYERCIVHREIWRIISAQLSHIELLHLLFNLSSTWSLRLAEVQGSTWQYLHTSLLLVLLSAGVYLAILHMLISVASQEQHRHTTVVGYSCVVFGWMTILSARGVANFSILGLAELPMVVAPFGSLLLTSVIFPRASFLGHLSGIIIGYLVAAGVFAWLTPWWLLSLLSWSAALGTWHLLQRGELALPWLQVQAEHGDVEAGGMSHIDAMPD